jgi:Holliday junction resolvase RusA-like endonuclease
MPTAAAIIAGQHERKAVDRVLLRLPMPPSSNAVWAHRKGGGVRLSDRYRRWLTDAGWRINQQRPGRIAGGYVLTLWLPAVSRMDQDNCIAGVSDILQSFGIIGNDRDAEETHLNWHGSSNDLIAELRPFVGLSRVQRPCTASEAA